MRCRMKSEKGFTLIEVLVSLVLISIVLTSFMAIFANTDRLAVSNSEKLVVINLADAYLERIKIQPTEFIGTLPPSMSNCTPAVANTTCKTVTVNSSPVNGKSYVVKITLKQNLTEKKLSLLDTVIKVSSPDSKVSSSVEGYVSYGQ